MWSSSAAVVATLRYTKIPPFFTGNVHRPNSPFHFRQPNEYPSARVSIPRMQFFHYMGQVLVYLQILVFVGNEGQTKHCKHSSIARMKSLCTVLRRLRYGTTSALLKDTTELICFTILLDGHHCISIEKMRRSKLPNRGHGKISDSPPILTSSFDYVVFTLILLR